MKKDSPHDNVILIEKMLQTRTILLSEEVNPKSARRIIESMLVLEADDPVKEITLIMNSPGGDVDSGFAVYDMIRYIRPDVKVVCAGLTASIAVVILLAVERENRIALPNARFLIHQPHIPMDVYGPASDLEITANEILKTKSRINKLISEATGQPLDKVEHDTLRDYWMSAEEAKEYGLVGRIVEQR